MGATESQMMNVNDQPHNADIYAEHLVWIAAQFNISAVNTFLRWVVYLWQEEPLLS